MLREGAEEAVHSLNAGKVPGVDSIPSELLKNGGEAAATVPTVIRRMIWETRPGMAEGFGTVVRHTYTSVRTIAPPA